VGGTPASISLDLEFPNFTGIAVRRDAPLSLSSGGNRLQQSIGPTRSDAVSSKFVSNKICVEQPLFRDRGIND
jgi:hypothetical protein